MKQSIEKNGGKVHVSSPCKEIVTNEDGTGAINKEARLTDDLLPHSNPPPPHPSPVKHLLMRDGSTVVADEYVSAMPVDIFKRFIPKTWSTMPFFRQVDELEGIPVINLHMWFDRKLKAVDHLCFSRSPFLSVYADMSTTCKGEKLRGMKRRAANSTITVANTTIMVAIRLH